MEFNIMYISSTAEVLFTVKNWWGTLTHKSGKYITGEPNSVLTTTNTLEDLIVSKVEFNNQSVVMQSSTCLAFEKINQIRKSETWKL